MPGRWMLLGLVILATALPAAAKEQSLALKAGKPGEAEFRLAAIRALYKRNYEIWTIDPNKVTGRYRGGAKMELILQDKAVLIRNATPSLLNEARENQYIQNLRRDLAYELAAYMITAPTSEERDSSNSTQPVSTPTGTAVSGSYVSRITTDSPYTFQKRSSRSLVLTLEQDGNNVNGINSEYDLKVVGTREGNKITFYALPSKIAAGEIEGEWQVSEDGRSLTGNWARGGASGIWNLVRE